MGGWLHVLSKENFQKWVEGQEIQTSLQEGAKGP
jgi:hypothetical protein